MVLVGKHSEMNNRNRVGIVTITNGPDNYGNTLQNYAVQYIMKDLGYASETIQNLSFVEYRRHGLYLLPKLFRDYTGACKGIKFHRFSKKNITYGKQIISANYSNWDELNKRYKAFICGSDQVWNPRLRSNQNWEVNLLKFVKERKRIALSASFGVSELSQEEESILAEPLKRFDAISVREKNAVDLIKGMTGKDATLLADPTMVLDMTVWEKIIKPVYSLNGKRYIVKYVLGEPEEAAEQAIKLFCEEHNIEIIVDLMNKKAPYYSSGPDEFLWLIKNAVFVCTDSFHATVFSILFKVPFCVLRRKGRLENVFGRLETLLTMFDMTERIYIEGNKLETAKEDSGRVEETVRSLKNELYSFLTNNIE